MRITFSQALSCGNAVRLLVEPTSGETRWRILRKESDTFVDVNDPAAFLVMDGSDLFVTDARLLVNGIPYFYAVYGELTPGVWSVPVKVSVTPVATFEDASIDVQEIIRDRLDATLNSMIQRGRLVLSKNSISVMSIPFYQQGGELPVVTVLYASGSSVVRGLGEDVGTDYFDGSSWVNFQGWHSAVTLEVSSWSLNAQERNSLRRALEAAIAANLDVLEDQGLNMVEVSRCKTPKTRNQ